MSEKRRDIVMSATPMPKNPCRRFWSSNRKKNSRKLAEMLTHNLHTLPVELRRFMGFLTHLTFNKKFVNIITNTYKG